MPKPVPPPKAPVVFWLLFCPNRLVPPVWPGVLLLLPPPKALLVWAAPKGDEVLPKPVPALVLVLAVPKPRPAGLFWLAPKSEPPVLLFEAPKPPPVLAPKPVPLNILPLWAGWVVDAAPNIVLPVVAGLFWPNMLPPVPDPNAFVLVLFWPNAEPPPNTLPPVVLLVLVAPNALED